MPPEEPSTYTESKDSEQDLAYMRSLSAAVLQRSPRHLVAVLLIMAAFMGAALLWMGFAEVDVVVRGNGKVIPSSQLQIVQSLEGGVVSEILVSEGDVVERAQPLMKISDIAFTSSYAENRLHYLELRAKMTRLTAEAHDTPFEPDEQVAKEAPELMASERSLFETNQQQLRETLQILDEQMSQSQNELLEAQAKQRQLRKSLSLMRDEIKIKKPLMERRLVSEVEFLQLRQREAEIEGDLEAVELSIPRIESTIEEGRRKVEQGRLDFRNKAKVELNEISAEASRIAETQGALKDRVQRTTLRAPVKGTVTRLHINTIGGVVPPGNPVVEIVPYEDALLIEVHIKPSDVANLRVGLPSRLKFSAYDFAIYGSIEGEVNFLSADTVTNEEGASFYTARIKPARDFFGLESRPLPIRVGMTAEADIITNKKTILQYLFKPINRGLERALRER
jgi:membrane fusion protein, adhesin transport system